MYVYILLSTIRWALDDRPCLIQFFNSKYVCYGDGYMGNTIITSLIRPFNKFIIIIYNFLSLTFILLQRVAHVVSTYYQIDNYNFFLVNNYKCPVDASVSETGWIIFS